jgi:LysM repeat protein
MIKLLFALSILFNPESPKDSVGMETVNGKMFIIHKVDEKETLFAISRRYGASVDAIVQYNATAASGLEIGQVLKVPYTPKAAVYKPAGTTVHKVEPKETMFSISKTYGVSVDDIKQWNNLTDYSLSIGQELVIRKKGNSTTATTQSNTQQTSNRVISKKGYHIVAEKETLFSIARQYNVTADQLKTWNNLEGNELKIGQSLYVAQPENGLTVVKKPDSVKTHINTNSTASNNNNASTPVEVKKDPQPVKTEVKEPVKESVPQTIKISESVKNGDEIVEGGLAELIEGTDGNRKYLALHRTAPVGTILKIKNTMNNREVFVRVMGKLPDTAVTDKLIIKISKSAYDRLGAIDQRFRVEVTYYK